MTDIVERLRSPANVFYEYAADNGAFLREAADEIERLREALRFYADEENWDAKLFFFNPQDPTVARSEVPKVAIDNGDIARAALKGEK